MKIMKHIKKFSEIGMSTKDKQKEINVSEAFHLWNHLVTRYSIIQTTEIMGNYARDMDLKFIINAGVRALKDQVKVLEKEMLSYGIPLPIRPPKQMKVASNMEIYSDRYIYRRILRGIQSYLPTHTAAFVHSTSPKIRELFMHALIEEMKHYDKFMEYGKLKGYVMRPPVYKP